MPDARVDRRRARHAQEDEVVARVDEQRATGRYITGNSESITQMIRRVQSATEAHFHASSGVADRFAALLDNAQKSCQRIPEVTRVVAELAQAAESARGTDGDSQPAA